MYNVLYTPLHVTVFASRPARASPLVVRRRDAPERAREERAHTRSVPFSYCKS